MHMGEIQMLVVPVLTLSYVLCGTLYRVIKPQLGRKWRWTNEMVNCFRNAIHRQNQKLSFVKDYLLQHRRHQLYFILFFVIAIFNYQLYRPQRNYHLILSFHEIGSYTLAWKLSHPSSHLESCNTRQNARKKRPVITSLEIAYRDRKPSPSTILQ